MSKLIEDLTAKVARINAELVLAKRELFEARVAEYPLRAGDIIENATGQVFKITRIANSYGSPSPMGLMKLKGGQWGTKERSLYSWSLRDAKKIGHEPVTTGDRHDG